MIFKKGTFLGTALAQNILAILLLLVIAIKVPVLFILILVVVFAMFYQKLKDYLKKNPELDISKACKELAQNDMMSFLQTKIIFASGVIIAGVMVIKLLGLAPEGKKPTMEMIHKMEKYMESSAEKKPAAPPIATAMPEVQKIIPSGGTTTLKESKDSDNFGSIK